MPHVILLKSKPRLNNEGEISMVLPKEDMSAMTDTNLRMLRLVIPNNILFVHEQGSVCVHIEHCDTCVFTTSNTKILCTFLCFPTNKNEFWTEYACDYLVQIPQSIKKNNTDFKVTVSQSNSFEYFESSKEVTTVIPNQDVFSKVQLQPISTVANPAYITYMEDDKIPYGFYSGGRFEYVLPFNKGRNECKITPVLPTSASYTEDGEMPGTALGGERIRWLNANSDAYALVISIVTDSCACILTSSLNNKKIRTVWGLKASSLQHNQSYTLDKFKEIINTDTNWDCNGVLLNKDGSYYSGPNITNHGGLFTYDSIWPNLNDPCLDNVHSPTYFKVSAMIRKEFFVLDQTEWNVMVLKCVQNRCTACHSLTVNSFFSLHGLLATTLQFRSFAFNGESTTIVESSYRGAIDFSKYTSGKLTFNINKPFWFTPKFGILLNKFTCNAQSFTHFLKIKPKNAFFSKDKYYFNATNHEDFTTVNVFKVLEYKNHRMDSTIRNFSVDIDNISTVISEAERLLQSSNLYSISTLHDTFTTNLNSVNNKLTAINDAMSTIVNNTATNPPHDVHIRRRIEAINGRTFSEARNISYLDSHQNTVFYSNDDFQYDLSQHFIRLIPPLTSFELFPRPLSSHISTQNFTIHDIETAFHAKLQHQIKTGTMTEAKFTYLKDYDMSNQLWTYNKAHTLGNPLPESSFHYLYVFSKTAALTNADIFVYELDKASLPTIKYKKSSMYPLGNSFATTSDSPPQMNTSTVLWVLSQTYFDPTVIHAINSFPVDTTVFFQRTLENIRTRCTSIIHSSPITSHIKPQGSEEFSDLISEKSKYSTISKRISKLRADIANKESQLMHNLFFLCQSSQLQLHSFEQLKTILQTNQIDTNDKVLADFKTKILSNVHDDDLSDIFNSTLYKKSTIFTLLHVSDNEIVSLYTHLQNLQGLLHSSNQDLIAKNHKWTVTMRTVKKYLVTWELPVFTSTLYFRLDDMYKLMKSKINIHSTNGMIFSGIINDNHHTGGIVTIILNKSLEGRYIVVEVLDVHDISWCVTDVFVKPESFQTSDVKLINDELSGSASIVRFSPSVSSEDVTIRNGLIKSFMNIDRTSLVYIDIQNQKVLVEYENSTEYTELYKAYNYPHIQISLVTH